MGGRSRAELVHERTVPGDERLSEQDEQLGDTVGGDDGRHDCRPAPQQRQEDRDRDPDRAERADPRESDREPVEPAGAMGNDPGLGAAVE